MTPGRVAVVGAGLAGLSAARRLRDAGAHVEVFDKSRGSGGRLSTRRTESHAFDHGAQYFTCRSDAFRQVVDGWLSRGAAEPWAAPIQVIEAGEVSVRPSDGPRYVGVPGMSALGRDLAADVEVHHQRRVEALAGGRGAWRLRFDDAGESEPFDAVVVATPAPQAVPLLAAAPSLAARVAEVEMVPCLAAMVVFAEKLDVEFGGAFVHASPLAWVARNDTKPGRASAECWVLHATPAWSAAHLEDPPEDVGRAAIAAFARALGRPSLPDVRFQTVHRWRYARTETPLGEPCLWDADAGLGACGDWTVGARVEDAFTSGGALAHAILADRTTP